MPEFFLYKEAKIRYDQEYPIKFNSEELSIKIWNEKDKNYTTKNF